ncbi:MAG: hypothetical protein H7321_09255 [Bacteroidia bacterium]|nr:hypothetical protein [Bacteroidia bacterium]
MKMMLSEDGFKKWDLITSGNKGTCTYVIRKRKKCGNTIITFYPYEKQDNAFTQFIWFQTLKLLVFLHIK